MLYGKANPLSRAADPRSKFLESFHNLLHRASQFFKEDNDTTVIADGFPLLECADAKCTWSSARAPTINSATFRGRRVSKC